MNHYKIDAKNKRLGRVASLAAHILMGKNNPDYQRNRLADISVELINCSDVRVDERSAGSKIYSRYSGYPGGLKQESMAKIIEKKGVNEALRRAIYGMLPKNKLRPMMMKVLTMK